MKKNNKKIKLLKALAFPVSAWFMFNVGAMVVNAEEVQPTEQTVETTNVSEASDVDAQAISNEDVQTDGQDVQAVDSATESVSYQTHVQDIGWQNEVSNGQQAGTTKQSKRIEAIDIQVDSQYAGNVVYQTHVQDIGWQNEVSNGQQAGTTKQSKKLEAIRIWLTGDLADHYSIQYRTHVQDIGWQDWVSDGLLSGTTGQGLRLEAIQIKLVDLSQSKYDLVQYTTHVQDIGWQNQVTSGAVAGTTKQSKRIEGIRVYLNTSKYSGDITYQAHVQNIGWQDSVSNRSLAGTEKQSLRIEAVRFNLTGEISEHYDIYYRVHCSDWGWLDWASNGNIAGTTKLSKAVEAIQIMLVEKGKTVHSSGVTSIQDGVAYVNGKVADGWNFIDGNEYYVSDGNVNKSNGWTEINGNYYYLSGGVKNVNTWIGDSYVDKDGKRLTGWQEINGNRYYFNTDGNRIRGYQTIDGNKYYFNSDGSLLTNGYINSSCDYADGNGIITTKHNYVEQFETIHHEEVGHNEQVLVQDAYDEQIPQYTLVAHEICNGCGADITDNPSAHNKAHMLAGESGGWHTKYVSEITSYTSVHHEAEYKTEYVVDQEAYDEVISKGYKQCTKCGVIE